MPHKTLCGRLMVPVSMHEAVTFNEQGQSQVHFLMILFFSDANLKLTLRPSNNLIDDSFAFIMRDDEDAPKIYENSLKLAETYANCFYQGDNSAFDLCDGGIVSTIYGWVGK